MLPKNTLSEVRIIGGQWRGRKIEFQTTGVRPTPDRVRETLFNWLAPEIVGMHALDLFSGSGALGFEALSRGALSTTFVDSHYQVISQIRKMAEKLGSKQAFFVHGTVPALQLYSEHSFDLVFLDPPYNTALLQKSIEWLEQHHYLSNTCLIYIENALDQEIVLPKNWKVIKDQKAGQVQYRLIERKLV